MKKIITVALLIITLIVSSIGLVACDNSASNRQKGLLMTKGSGNSYYTVHGFVAEDDSTVLDIGSYATDGVVIGRIKANAFSGNDTIKEIIVPDTVTIIDEGAFSGMEKLEKITIPFVGAKVLADGSLNQTKPQDKAVNQERTFGYMFGKSKYDFSTAITQNYNATETETYYLPMTLKEVVIKPAAADYTLPMYAFYGVSILRKVTLSSNVKEIGDYAFTNCVSLNTVSHIDADNVAVGLSSTVTYLGDGAFSGCINLKDADLTNATGFKFNDNNAIETLGVETFKGVGLNEVTLPDNVKELGAGCFRDSMVTKFMLGNSAQLTKIGTSCFNGCINFVRFNSANDYEIKTTGIEVGAFAFINLDESKTYNII